MIDGTQNKSLSSLLSIDDVIHSTHQYADIRSDGNCIYFLARSDLLDKTHSPKRQTIIQYCPTQKTWRDLLPKDYTASSSIHNYGGGSFNVDSKSGVYFINGSDGQIYHCNPESGKITQISHDLTRRFADIVIDKNHYRIFACGETLEEPSCHIKQTSSLFSFFKDSLGQWHSHIFCDDADFYANPRLAPNGESLVWLEWDEGDMPWEGARLMHARFFYHDSDYNHHQSPCIKPEHKKLILKAPCYNPQWKNSHGLYVIHDCGVTGRLYYIDTHSMKKYTVTDIDYDGLEAMWGLEMRNFCVLSDGSVIIQLYQNSVHCLFHITRDNREHEQHKWIITPLTHNFSDIQLFCPINDTVLCALVYQETCPATPYLLSLDASHTLKTQSLYPHNNTKPKNHSFISCAEHINVVIENYPPCYALYYPACQKIKNTPCPVIFSFHGGPAGRANRGYKAKIQYWTQRGIGFLDIDYYGSTGYGRLYREKLYGQWGKLEVKIAHAFAQYLISHSIADPQKLALYGSSAGGYSALSIITHTSLFQAAIIAYGIADMEKLYASSDRFEKHYLLKLIGASCEVDPSQALRNASPIHKANAIHTPVLLLQGENDPIVPKEQTRMMYNTLQDNAIDSFYLELPGEKHGFKQSENIRKALQAEHVFYQRFLGYPLEEIKSDVF